MLDQLTCSRLQQLSIGSDVFYLNAFNEQAWGVIAGFKMEAIGKYYERVFIILDDKQYTEISLASVLWDIMEDC